jgi:hypothetical protein
LSAPASWRMQIQLLLACSKMAPREAALSHSLVLDLASLKSVREAAGVFLETKEGSGKGGETRGTRTSGARKSGEIGGRRQFRRCASGPVANTPTTKVWTSISTLKPALAGDTVLVRGHLQLQTVRAVGKGVLNSLMPSTTAPWFRIQIKKIITAARLPGMPARKVMALLWHKTDDSSAIFSFAVRLCQLSFLPREAVLSTFHQVHTGSTLKRSIMTSLPRSTRVRMVSASGMRTGEAS